jgi:hypothetical protein
MEAENNQQKIAIQYLLQNQIADPYKQHGPNNGDYNGFGGGVC